MWLRIVPFQILMLLFPVCSLLLLFRIVQLQALPPTSTSSARNHQSSHSLSQNKAIKCMHRRSNSLYQYHPLVLSTLKQLFELHWETSLLWDLCLAVLAYTDSSRWEHDAVQISGHENEVLNYQSRRCKISYNWWNQQLRCYHQLTRQAQMFEPEKHAMGKRFFFPQSALWSVGMQTAGMRCMITVIKHKITTNYQTKANWCFPSRQITQN